jgi:uncharacterized membrane protein YjfL (UPF0719 family)
VVNFITRFYLPIFQLLIFRMTTEQEEKIAIAKFASSVSMANISRIIGLITTGFTIYFCTSQEISVGWGIVAYVVVSSVFRGLAATKVVCPYCATKGLNPKSIYCHQCAQKVK